ncbi:MAG: hypothetical protein ABW056_06675 [Thermoanaerobaculia bacterium]
MFVQTAIEKEIAGRVESRIGKLLGSTAAAMAFARLCELPPVWKPTRQYPARKARHRLELAYRLLALEDSLALGEKEWRGASRKVMAALPERLHALASVVAAVNRAPESPVERLLARAFQACQTRKDADAIAIALSDRARDFLHLPETLRDYAGFVAADELLANFSGNRLTMPARRDFVPRLRSAQKVRLLDYVEGWSGSPHYREVACLVLRVEGRPDSALDTEIADLKRMKRGFRGQIPLAL